MAALPLMYRGSGRVRTLRFPPRWRPRPGCQSGSLFARDGTPPARSLLFLPGFSHLHFLKALDPNLLPIESFHENDQPPAFQGRGKAKKSPRGKRSHGRPPAPRWTKPNQKPSRDVGLAGAKDPGSLSLSALKQETLKVAGVAGEKWQNGPPDDSGPLGAGEGVGRGGRNLAGR